MTSTDLSGSRSSAATQSPLMMELSQDAPEEISGERAREDKAAM